MIQVERAHLLVAAGSHPGMSGKNNEDRYKVIAYRLEADRPIPSVFAMISDGIGGHHAGEVAAEIAVETITGVVSASDGTTPTETLRQAIVQASETIYAKSQQGENRRGMGATCTCAWVIEDKLFTASVGDSRLYLVRQGNIQQLSKDHTWIQEALDYGILTPEQAQGHPNSHVIRRYLGSQQTVEPDTRLRLHSQESDIQSEANQGLRLLPGDQILLCSDGLTDLVKDEEIQAALTEQAPEAAISLLTDMANQRGGHDNITLVILQAPTATPRSDQPRATAAARRKPSMPTWVFIAAAVLILITGISMIGGLVVILNRSNDAAPTTTINETLPVTAPATLPADLLSPTALNTSPAGAPATAAPGESAPTLTPWPTNTNTPPP